MKALQSDDLRVGMIVTMGKGRAYEERYGGGMFSESPATLISKQDRSYQGDILRIECVDLPYVVFRKLRDRFGFEERKYEGSSSCGGTSVNTSEGWQFALCSEEYARSLGYTGPMSIEQPEVAQ